MKARLALVVVFLVALCLPAVAPVGAASTAAAAPGWLDRFNAIRAAAGLSPVVEQASLTSDAVKHVNYMLLNPDEFEHYETPGRPGYTTEGDRSAKQSNLFRSSGNVTAEATIDAWMDSLGHRYGMLRPELQSTAHALGCNNQGCAAVLNVLGGLQNGNTNPVSVVYPGNGQVGVATNMVSWQFRPFDPQPNPLVTLKRATFTAENGQAVPFTTLPAQQYFNVVAIRATTALTPGVTYTVTMEVEQNGVTQQRTWSFTYGAGVSSPCAGFSDVSASNPACAAIAALSSQGIINGYATNPPTFGPSDAVQRAQIAAFLVRALGWQGESTSPRSFTDFGSLVAELKTASLVLANQCDPQGNCVAKGYEPASCAARGKTAPCFGPNDSVTYAQVISFIARAYVREGRWTPQSAPHPYGGVPGIHESDVRTFYAYTVGLGGVPDGGALNWNNPAPRAWVARALYQALQSTP